MKVMQELVAYFDRRGRLSPKQIRALLDQGLLASDAPPNMLGLAEDVGATYYFRVTGDATGALWGTDVYTGDSALAIAAVHAGLVKPGQTAVLKVTVVSPLAQYQGSVRHGVTSHDFGRYGTAYRLDAV
jgi:hypothetical protein